MRLGPTLFVLACAAPLSAADFGPDAVTFLQKHCLGCHGEKKKSAGVALHTATDEASLLKSRKTFQSVLRVLEAGEMPPEGKPRPAVEEVEKFKAAITRTFDTADR